MSSIYVQRTKSDRIVLRLGSLNDNPDGQEKSHIWVLEQASCYEIDSSLPQHAQFEKP